MKKIQGMFVLCLLVVLQSPAWAGPVLLNQSEIKATFKQFNAPVTGRFKKFSGSVDFYASKPEATKGELIIQTDSYDLGDASYNKEVAGTDWFSSKKYPSAIFKVKRVKAVGKALQGEGELTLRGVTKKVSFPVSLLKQADVQVFTGKATINRLDFGVGQGDWSDTALVDNAIVIDFKLTVSNK
jgi:polyisoprenoid-binding protein YceI